MEPLFPWPRPSMGIKITPHPINEYPIDGCECVRCERSRHPELELPSLSIVPTVPSAQAVATLGERLGVWWSDYRAPVICTIVGFLVGVLW